MGYDSNENNTVVIGKANNEYVVNTYSFDKDNNLTYLTHNGFGYEFNYDNDGNMTDIVAANRTLVSYKYKKSSQEGNDEEKEDVMSTMTYGNNYKYDYEYDDKDNVIAIKIDNKLAYEMTYDANNNMTKQVDKLNGITYEYEYDGEGNVKSVKGSDGFNISYVNKKSETIEEDGDSVTKG